MPAERANPGASCEVRGAGVGQFSVNPWRAVRSPAVGVNRLHASRSKTVHSGLQLLFEIPFLPTSSLKGHYTDEKMRELTARTPADSTDHPIKVSAEIAALHRCCGVYTKPSVVAAILDKVGWRSENDLSTARLLEPAAGDGAFLVEAARRLIASFIRHDVELRTRTLAQRIVGFDLHPLEVQKARQRLLGLLQEQGLHHRTANACARSWILNEDFLLTELPVASFTHTVGNPPYLRWSKIPNGLRTSYERCTFVEVVGGDLCLPFMDRALTALRSGGKCGLLCSDRWKFMAFAEDFRNKWLPYLDIESECTITATGAFVKDVNSYPMILIASKRFVKKRPRRSTIARKGRSLEELGCVVRVGPALGHTPAFVLRPDEKDVEHELLQPWVSASEILEETVAWGGRRVIAMNQSDGKLINLDHFPMLESRLARFRERLKARSIVTNGAPWFSPIDRVIPENWKRPKLLIPELAKVPRAAIDRTGAIPSHGVYALFADDDDVDGLHRRLRDGRLAAALAKVAPTINGGYYRCYRRFLSMIRV